MTEDWSEGNVTDDLLNWLSIYLFETFQNTQSSIEAWALSALSLSSFRLWKSLSEVIDDQ